MSKNHVIQDQSLPPRLARTLLSVLTPKDLLANMEFLEDFDELYRTRVIPRLGVKGARRWVWGQVFRTVVVLAWDKTMMVLGKSKKRAR